MPLTASIYINRSVGQGAVNAADDVRTIQARLNEIMPAGRTRLAVDGKCGPLSRGAIKEFQSVVCGMQFPDARVDPGKRTITAMNDEVAVRRWGAAGPHSAAPAAPNMTPEGNPSAGNGAPLSTEKQRAVEQEIEKIPASRGTGSLNKIPTADGELNSYEAPDFRDTAFFNRGRQAVFVNGMDNTAVDHFKSAQLLSSVLRCPVYGLYNKSSGKAADFVQCAGDKAGILGVATYADSSFQALEALLRDAMGTLAAAGSSITRVQVVEWMLADNRATLELFRHLRSGSLRHKHIPIYAHSQGNLISSNALTAVALTDGLAAIKGREVHSYGSPCRWWPPGLERHDHAFALDPIPLLRLRRDMDTVQVLTTFGDFTKDPISHNFALYMERDPDFIINSCCWGVHGYLRLVNTKELAERLVQEGNNAGRVMRVFERLIETQWGEEDDVALAYCRHMKQRAPLIMQLMVRDMAFGQLLVDALVKCLTGRTLFASGEERQMAEWVQGLRAR